MSDNDFSSNNNDKRGCRLSPWPMTMSVQRLTLVRSEEPVWLGSAFTSSWACSESSRGKVYHSVAVIELVCCSVAVSSERTFALVI